MKKQQERAESEEPEERESLNSDYDSGWKEAIETYFKEFMAFFFSAAHDEIDFLKGYEFLDKELEKVVRDAELGKPFADKLVKVYLADGQEKGLEV